MHRREFLKRSGSAALGLAISGCASRIIPETVRSAAVRRRPVDLVAVDVSMDRIIRTTVGLRPHRDSGFLLKAERFNDRMLIHNFGHGGAGMSLSWGTAFLAADLAMAHTERRAAVIGCGIIGLTSARQLQRRGFVVTIYAMAMPPSTTSNMSWAGFTPASGLISRDRRTPAWDDQFRRVVEISYREHQLIAGSRYGVSWIDHYSLFDGLPAAPAPHGPDDLLPPGTVEIGSVVLGPGEHPFGTRYATRQPLMRFEPSIYLDALMRDVMAFGGRLVHRSFATPRDLLSLSEPLIVNCTGLGAKALFGDDELMPIKGQSTLLVPQPEVTYSVEGMLPRSDGIVLGATWERGVWTLDVDEDAQLGAVEYYQGIFDGMRTPAPGNRK